MRLDEWQKYIEAQFLDEVEEMPVSDAPTASRLSDDMQPKSDEIETDRASRPDCPETSTGESGSQQYAADEAAEAALFSPIPDVAPEPPVPVATPATSSHKPLVDPPHRRADFGTTPEFDIAIPAFDSYLPATRRPASEEPPADLPARDGQTDDRSLAGHRSSIGPEVRSHSSAAGATAVPGADAAAPPGPSLASPAQVVKRTPKSRARHAKNVRPDHVPSGLSAGELWAQVPKHVQTLLALERMEEEQEVAQFSYKRPFQEKRHELIERLLDPILSLEDAARLLNVCPTTVRRYTNKGILTYYRKEQDRVTKADPRPRDGDAASALGSEKETRQRRFRLSDILAFLETQQAALQADRNAEDTESSERRKRITRVSQPPDPSASWPDAPDYSAPTAAGKA